MNISNESFVFSKDDIEYNLNKWKSGSSNILFITGLSGSGKSTLTKELAKQYNAIIFELDLFEWNGILFDKNNTQDKGNIIMKKVFKSIYGGYKSFKGCDSGEFGKQLEVFLHKLIQIAKADTKNKYIIEGIQISKFKDGKIFDEINNYPLIIKGTSMLESIKRRRKRDINTSDGMFKNPYKLIKWYINSEKQIAKYRKRKEDDNMNSNDIEEANIALEAKLKKLDRDKLSDSAFGIPSLRKYPLYVGNDDSHIRNAIAYFWACPQEHKKTLAANIVKAIKKMKYDVKIASNSEICKLTTVPAEMQRAPEKRKKAANESDTFVDTFITACESMIIE